MASSVDHTASAAVQPEGANDGSGSDTMVSSFDLEPNPFEQSFASSKKPHSLRQAMAGPGGRSVPVVEPSTSLNAETSSSFHTTTVNSNHNADIHSRASSIAASTGPSNVVVTVPNATVAPTNGASTVEKPSDPSTRLPPLLLANPSHSSTLLPKQHTKPSDSTPPAPVLPNPNQHPHALLPPGNTTPSFFINLSKSGLTPNSSSLRTGLTPGILSSAQHPHSHLQTHPPPHSQSQQGHHSILPAHPSPNLHPPAHVVPPLSLPMGQFTPGFSSILGSLHQQQPTSQTGPNTTHNPQPWDPVANHTLNASTTVNSYSSTSSNSTNTIPLEAGKDSSTTANSVTGSSGSNSSSALTKVPSASSTHQTDLDSLKPSSFHHSVSSNSSNEPPSKKPRLNQGFMKRSKELIEPTYSGSRDDQERKRKEFLERNRVAASKFRKRKKEYIKKIESDLKFYETEYDDLGQCMDKLCGISKQTINSSLVGMLKQALLQHDMNSSLTLCNHIEQTLLQTQYVQRGGRNPRHEEEEKRRLENPDGDNSDFGYPRRSSMAAASSDGYHHMHSQSQQELESTGMAGSHVQPSDHATGTINNLPLVINGNTLLSLEDIQASSQYQKSNDSATNGCADGQTSIKSLKVEDGLSDNLHNNPASN
ncbi:LANO_0H03466g1_1 [Lachancea nothofagi CBS 11611]|uniref:LANO_0H03466g1_1 n=1 Tax=Lachancea nothofagi CBS 11611 TaxID=1266666 RepID=A0A1G4KL91_9SACH|nr:LANO_0H03466g1_1 [Lachancea nothofagi CBS 11611]